MKIIIKDNFDRDYMSDTLVAENVHQVYADLICKAVNRIQGEHSCKYWTVQPDDYKLYKFEP